jgi:hypothetical protein
LTLFFPVTTVDLGTLQTSRGVLEEAKK